MRIDFEACFLYIVYNDDITSDRTMKPIRVDLKLVTKRKKTQNTWSLCYVNYKFLPETIGPSINMQKQG